MLSHQDGFVSVGEGAGLPPNKVTRQVKVVWGLELRGGQDMHRGGIQIDEKRK